MVKAKVESKENSRVVLEIEVPAEDFAAAVQQAYQKMAPSIQIPGFRRGKAPRQLIEARYGREIFYEDALEIAVPKAYLEAIEEMGIDPIDRPDIDIVSMGDDEPLVFKAEVTVMPEVTLGQYKGLEVTKNIYPVQDHQVEAQLEAMRERMAELVAVEDRDVVEMGDFATIDFTGYIDGEPFPGGAATGYQLEIGSGQFIPGFEEQLVGAKTGSEVEINVTLPENYEPSLAGKEAVFKVKIDELKVKRLPELDDEFAKDVSEETDTLEALKASIRKNLEAEAEERSNAQVRNDLVDQAATNAEVEIPEVLIEREAENQVAEFQQMLAYQGMTLDMYLEHTGQTREQLREQFTPQATVRVRNGLVLEAIAEAEGLEVTEEEIDAKIDEYVKDMPEPEKARERYQGFRENIKNNLLTTKTIDFLVESAKITEVEVEADSSQGAEETGPEVEAEVTEEE